MSDEQKDGLESSVEEGLTLYIDTLLRNIQSPVKRGYAKQLLLNDFNNTLPRGIYMDNEIILDGDDIEEE
ncbi:hypothetical protein A9Q99_24210 [Gammaproteobacteria bacterium 45_16_T64]|nr:hypothetical protein A9Q99_24210 [Gammaproteobacteria bacterium 45_16_T64]